MATLTQDSKGNYKARKRLPEDVREEYGRLYGPRFEAKFSLPASTKPHEAKRLFGEWLSEVEGRIANIRAQRKGDGVSLTREQARALAGEWYGWFLARHASSDMDPQWAREQVRDAMCKAVGEKRWEANHPDELWEQEEELRSAVRPVLADVGETAQFLATKSSALEHRASQLGLFFEDEDKEILSLMASTDAVIRSRYIQTGYFQWPDPKALDRTCKSLRQSVGHDRLYVRFTPDSGHVQCN